MSKNHTPTVFAAIFSLFAMAAHAQQDVSAPNAELLLREIEAMEGKQKEAKLQEKKALLGAILSAAASGSSAASFYEKAVEEVQFKGKKDKVVAFLDWKKANADLMRSKEMQAALLLHLKYLSLALQRKGMEHPETMIPGLMAYVNDLVAADKVFADQKQKPNEQRNLLDQPLAQSVFSQWLKLDQWLPEAKVWEPKPGDLAGILEKNVRPLLREKKDPQLLQTWDMQLNIEAGRITEARSEYQIEKFNSSTRPTLLFKRAQDMVVLGQPNRGVAEMVAVLRANPSHPDFAAWLAAVRALLSPPADQTSPQ
ncbi:MAG: hypothetical protein WCS65_10825 [Verrucomicrobiae bacterium]